MVKSVFLDHINFIMQPYRKHAAEHLLELQCQRIFAFSRNVNSLYFCGIVKSLKHLDKVKQQVTESFFNLL